MQRHLVAISDSVFPNLDLAAAVLARVNGEIRLAKDPKPDAILAVARDADALMTTYAKITGDVIRQLTRCRIIARFGVGIDNIDVPVAIKQGILSPGCQIIAWTKCLKTPWRPPPRSARHRIVDPPSTFITVPTARRRSDQRVGHPVPALMFARYSSASASQSHRHRWDRALSPVLCGPGSHRR